MKSLKDRYPERSEEELIRDKFLSELVLHQCCTYNPDHNGECLTCDEWYEGHIPFYFGTPIGFFKLWNWFKYTGYAYNYLTMLLEPDDAKAVAKNIGRFFTLIEPNKFADEVYKFLKEQGEDNEGNE